MTSMMSVAAGLAIGYFAYQYIAGNRKGTTRGRLHKSKADKKISGVCGGVAEYLGCDPTIVRLAWAVLCCGWGTGILLYAVCAFVLPEE